jgi:CRISP-associated protein Cas1
VSAAVPLPWSGGPRRKSPAVAQYNWITGGVDFPPEQLEFDLPPVEDVELPEDRSVSLLATENGAQLVVAGFGLYLGKKGERITVKQSRKVVAQAPLMRLQEVVVASRGVSFSSDLIEELCSRGIRLACLSASGRPFALITSPMLTATVETRRAQLAAFDCQHGADFCRWVVAGKLHNQEKLLLYFGKSRSGHARAALETAAGQVRKLRRQALAVEGGTAKKVRGSLMGLEGTAGRIYWQRIGDILPDGAEFGGRQHQGAADAVNAALNYGYGILTAHVWGAVMNAGLEPFAGFLHVDRSGKPSLVLDLMEEFRQPVVDRPLLAWLNKGGQLRLDRGMLDVRSKEEVGARVLARMTAVEQHRGRRHEIRSIIQMQARSCASSLRSERPYRPFSFRW